MVWIVPTECKLLCVSAASVVCSARGLCRLRLCVRPGFRCWVVGSGVALVGVR